MIVRAPGPRSWSATSSVAPIGGGTAVGVGVVVGGKPGVGVAVGVDVVAGVGVGGGAWTTDVGEGAGHAGGGVVVGHQQQRDHYQRGAAEAGEHGREQREPGRAPC